MSTALAERQISLMETSTKGERKWKNPNQIVRIRRKVRARYMKIHVCNVCSLAANLVRMCRLILCRSPENRR